MAKFYPLTVKNIQRETQEAVSVTFEVPQSLKQTFSYKQGQYLTIKKKLNDEEVRRSYSFCSSPLTDEDLIIAVKEVPNGKLSPFMNHELKVGEQLEVMKPAGNFYTELKEDQAKHYVGFAGGSGITPFMSIIKSALTKEKNSLFTLFYGNRDRSSIIFKDKLNQWEKVFKDRFKVVYILSEENTSDPLFHGLMTKDKYNQLIQHFTKVQKADEYFICGPYPMIENGIEVLKELNIPDEHVHYELFSVPEEETTSDQSKGETTQVAHITLILDDEKYEYTHENEWQTILDSALENDIDAPYSCRGGICATCRAKLTEGEVRMKMNYALSDREVEEGYILTCQSIPETEQIVVNFDEQ